jgi:oligoendopeptidase F
MARDQDAEGGWGLGRHRVSAQDKQAASDKDAAARREADLKAAADSVAAARAAQDEEIAQRRLTEDEELSDTRKEEDRVIASARNRLSVAAAAVGAATASVSAGGDPAELRVANAELQEAVAGHLAAVPEPPPAVKAGADKEGAGQ